MLCPCPPSIDSTATGTAEPGPRPFRAGGTHDCRHTRTGPRGRQGLPDRAVAGQLPAPQRLRLPRQGCGGAWERRITYRQLDERVNRLASALILAGIAPGDRVAFLAPNIPPLLEAHYGVPAAGAVLVAINTRLGRDEVAYILRHSGARMVFADHELLHLEIGRAHV